MSVIAVFGNWHYLSNADQYARALEGLGHTALRIGPRYRIEDADEWRRGLTEMEWRPTPQEADDYVNHVLVNSVKPDIETSKGAVYDRPLLGADAAIEFWAYGDSPRWTEAHNEQHHAVVFGDTHTSHLSDQVAQVRNGNYDSVWVQFRRDDLAAFDHPSKHWLPAAANPEVWKPNENVQRDLDVLFVGSTHPHVHKDRVALIRYLCDNGINVTVKHAFGSDAAKLMARAKVVLSRSLAGDLAMRVPEALMCGAYLVTDYVDGLETFHGWHSYESQQEALSVIRYALDRREVERRMLGRATRMNAEAEHSYEARCRTLLQTMGLPEEGDGRTEARPNGHTVSRDSGSVAGRPRVVVSGGGSDVPRDDVGRLASIIIPAYNKWELTRRCYDALHATLSPAAHFEILVVDDGSTDETARLNTLGWARILHKPNSGFCGAVNYGVKNAKCEYVVILNNDALPDAGFLAPLIEELKHGAGIVGSLILNPDGSVQAAGLEQMPDGTWRNKEWIGQEWVGERHERDVPSIQGACFAMRRDTYLRIGGLEEAWGNGGCCEVDLSLRVAKEGLPVRLRLDSKVKHAEGSTRFHIEGIGVTIAENQRRLIERWGMPDVRNGSSDSGGSDVPDSGSSARVRDRGADVHIERGGTGTLAVIGGRSEKPLTLVWDGHTDVVTGGSIGLINKAVTDALRAQGNYVFHGIPSIAHVDVNGGAPDAHITHLWPGPNAHPLPNTNAPHWIVIQPYELPNLPPEWAKTWAHPRFRLLITPSAYSERLFFDAFPELQGKTLVIPNGVDLDVFNPEGEKAPGRDDLWRCLFVGGLIWRKGLGRLYEAWRLAFPPEEGAPAVLILKSQGRNSFYQGQSIDPPTDLVRPQNVYPTVSLIDRDMEASELASIYRRVDCLVHPFRYEGFCLPLLEGMASGKPVIYPSHPPAVEFIPDAAGLAIPSVDHEIDVTSLARGLRWLFEHREDGNSMGAVGRAAALRFSWDKVSAKYAEAIRRVCGC